MGGGRRADATVRARVLRRNQTEAERLLWSRLRARRLGGWKFRRQQPIAGFIVDFCAPDAWLVIEIDGGQHNAEEASRRDALRTRAIEVAGYHVIRFWNNEVLGNLDGVCQAILAAARGCPLT